MADARKGLDVNSERNKAMYGKIGAKNVYVYGPMEEKGGCLRFMTTESQTLYKSFSIVPSSNKWKVKENPKESD